MEENLFSCFKANETRGQIKLNIAFRIGPLVCLQIEGGQSADFIDDCVKEGSQLVEVCKMDFAD